MLTDNIPAGVPGEFLFDILFNHPISDCIYHFLIDLEQQTDRHLDPNQSKNGKYDLISGWFNKILKKNSLCVCVRNSDELFSTWVSKKPWEIYDKFSTMSSYILPTYRFVLELQMIMFRFVFIHYSDRRNVGGKSEPKNERARWRNNRKECITSRFSSAHVSAPVAVMFPPSSRPGTTTSIIVRLVFVQRVFVQSISSNPIRLG